MRSHDDLVETFSAHVRDDSNADFVTLNRQHRRVQPLVRDALNNLLDVVTRAAGDGPPLRPIGDLNQTVVVAETDHSGDRKLQHLVGRARPDAAHHRQKIPVAELLGKFFGPQKIAKRLLHVGIAVGTGQRGGDAVEANDIGQHAQELGVDQVAALGKHAAEAGAAPFQSRAVHCVGHFYRERHVGFGGFYTQISE